MKLPRFLLAAAASGSGKTLITCGILQILKNRGLKVASFKCGPDYIDPMFHSRVIGTKSRNLDSFFTTPETTRYLMQKNGAESEIAVLEGVMGYYDGLAGISTKASAFDVADITATPVVFIVNCKGMSVSVIPYIKGFLEYIENSHIKGVILNQLSPSLYQRLKDQIEAQLAVKVYGYVPPLPKLMLENRHLGLVMPDEISNLQNQLQELAQVLTDSLDVDGLLTLAGQAPELNASPVRPESPWQDQQTVRIAVARDEAFCFHYEDNLQLLRELGAELIEFSPLHDQELPPDIQGLILNGGYPELYAGQLSDNVKLRTEIKAALADGLICLAECGGFMYLHDELEDMEGNTYPMVGTITGKAYRTSKLHRFGYITLQGGQVFGADVGTVNAHEFHYFDSTGCGTAFVAKKPLSSRSWRCIHSTATLLAGFPHLYFYSNPEVARSYLKRCSERKLKR